MSCPLREGENALPVTFLLRMYKFFIYAHARPVHTGVTSSCCRPQFVNHVYNSQQLSNKALLAGHLAYRNYHHRRRLQQLRAHQQCSEDRGDPSNSGGHDDHSCEAAGPGAAGVSRPGLEEALETRITNPEAFFPRCWDVSDDGDGVCSMLKAFAVAAAVALLRMAVKAAEVWLGCPSL